MDTLLILGLFLNRKDWVHQITRTVAPLIEEKNGKKTVRVNAKLQSILKYDMKSSAEVAKDIVEEIERDIGAKLDRT